MDYITPVNRYPSRIYYKTSKYGQICIHIHSNRCSTHISHHGDENRTIEAT